MIKFKQGFNSSKWQAWVDNKVIAETSFPTFALIGDKERVAHTELINGLVAQGWEVLTSDQYGRVITMRR